MATNFVLRSDSLNAYRNVGATTTGTPIVGAGATTPVVEASAAGDVFGGQLINMHHATIARALSYRIDGSAFANNKVCFLVRFVPQWTGTNSGSTDSAGNGRCPLVEFSGGATASPFDLVSATLLSEGSFHLVIQNKDGQNAVVHSTTAKFSAVSGTAVEFMVSWDGSTTAGAVKISKNGVLWETATAARAADFSAGRMSTLIVGMSAYANVSPLKINEVVVFDTAENPVYAARSGFYTATALNGGLNTSAGAGNIRSGSTEVIAGETITGTLVPVTNELEEVTIAATAIGAINIAQGDTVPWALRVKNGTNEYVDLTGATITVRVKHTDANEGEVSMANSQVTIDPDQVTNKGKFTIAPTLLQAQNFKVKDAQDVLVDILTQDGYHLTARGAGILNVDRDAV
jgi:hypothetical protein